MIDRIKEFFRRARPPVTEADLQSVGERLQVLDDEIIAAEKCLSEAQALVMQNPSTYPLRHNVSVDTFIDQCRRARTLRAAEQTVEALKAERRALYDLVTRFENGQ